jgi:hypothetical protein
MANNEIDSKTDAAAAANPAIAANEAFHSELHNTTILLMRHAEKPGDSHNPDLSPAGFARAKELAKYIPKEFGRQPDFIFATSDSKHSSRPRETVEPLSKESGVPVETPYADKDFDKLAHDIENDPKYAGKFIVIAWHHGEIPNLADSLGAPEGTYPNPWPDDRFNHILEFQYGAHGGKPKVTDLTEKF